MRNKNSQAVGKNGVSPVTSTVSSFQPQSQKKWSWCSDLPYQTYSVSSAQSLNKGAQDRERRQVREHQYFCTEYTDTCSQLICVSEVPPSDQEAHLVFKSQETELCHCSTMESDVLLLYDIIKWLSILFIYFDKRKVALSPTTLNTYIGLSVSTCLLLCTLD